MPFDAPAPLPARHRRELARGYGTLRRVSEGARTPDRLDHK